VNLKDVSAPSVTTKRIRQKVRRKSNRDKLREVVSKEVRHLTNAAEHRGDKDAISRARELTQYVAACLAIVQPYEPNGVGGFQATKNGDKQEFWEWLKHMKDLLALRLPYERPRLASITLREETPEDEDGYKTVYEMRTVLMKEGLPVDHLADRPLMLDHDIPDDDAGAHPTNGHATNGR
jgi:hypothetical protein